MGRAEASVTYRPGTPCTWPSGPATLDLGSLPIRHDDIWCAVKSRIRLADIGRAASDSSHGSNGSPFRQSCGGVTSGMIRLAPAARWTFAISSDARRSRAWSALPGAYRIETPPSRASETRPSERSRTSDRNAAIPSHRVIVSRWSRLFHHGNPVAMSPGWVGAASMRKPQRPSISANASLMTLWGTPDQGDSDSS